jgi:aspartyl protease family protein
MNISTPAQASYGGNVRIAADRGGHYRAEIRVNGHSVDALVDTGASLVVLRYEDARALGLVYGSDRFDVPVQTANGTAHVRRVKLASVRLGSIQFDDVEALVAEEGMLATNLLGMSFLKRLSRYEMRDGTLVLDR